MFHDVGISSKYILKDIEQGIDPPKAMKLRDEQDDYHENDKNESPTITDDHQVNNHIGYITNHTFGYFVKVKSGKISVV